MMAFSFLVIIIIVKVNLFEVKFVIIIIGFIIKLDSQIL